MDVGIGAGLAPRLGPRLCRDLRLGDVLGYEIPDEAEDNDDDCCYRELSQSEYLALHDVREPVDLDAEILQPLDGGLDLRVLAAQFADDPPDGLVDAGPPD